MAIKDFLQGIEAEVKSLLNPSSKVGITKTLYVPNVEDSGFNLGAGEILKAKTIDTCVLFIDIRKSTQLNFTYSEDVLAKLYAAFIKSMLKAAEYFGGKVRNINGDRVMVVFNTQGCFKAAIDTACLMHTISRNIIDTAFTQAKFECGIGIDYGEMVVVKTGTIKQGDENQFYKSFVWLGKPANLSSKLTDLANKENAVITLKHWYTNPLRGLIPRPSAFPGIFPYGSFPPARNTPVLTDVKLDYAAFAEKLDKPSAESTTKYQGSEVVSWSRTKVKSAPILITEEFYNGLKKEAGQSEYFTQSIITESSVKVTGYNGKVYGLDAIYNV